MPTIDSTSREVIFTLAGSGMLLIALSLAIRHRSASRGKWMIHAIGIIGGLALGIAGGLYFVPPDPDWFSSPVAWATVECGDIVITAVGHGEVEPTDITHVVCKVHARTPGAAWSAIRWVIDQPMTVKKGDLLIELDDSEWQKELKEQTIAPERRKFVEEQIANCRILSPRDGVAIYYIEERRRGPGGWSPIAQGESVKEGQRLITIFDPAKMAVRTHLSYSQRTRISLGQAVRVHVDRFPDRTFAGQISHLDNTPRANTVEVKLSDAAAGLMPGMSANVSIDVAHRQNVLHVPAKTLLHSGDKTICFVKSGRKIQIRVVGIGMSDSQVAEITNGLKEGEQVLHQADWMRIPVSAE